MRRLISAAGLAVLALHGSPLRADTVLAARTLRPQTVISPADLVVGTEDIPGFASSPQEVIGLETRIAIYQGRPIRLSDLGPQTIVSRNQIVELRYRAGGLTITVEGRALASGGVGERIRVMNPASRASFFGTIAEDGSVWVQTDS
ncbi:MAG: flagellar basal body P-ring formation protein FlgA [Rhodobacteraceae bacterium]|nr:flagellar basal body P-ring formation protein FlgA [Paracoccaceae bacterium]